MSNDAGKFQYLRGSSKLTADYDASSDIWRFSRVLRIRSVIVHLLVILSFTIYGHILFYLMHYQCRIVGNNKKYGCQFRLSSLAWSVRDLSDLCGSSATGLWCVLDLLATRSQPTYPLTDN